MPKLTGRAIRDWQTSRDLNAELQASIADVQAGPVTEYPRTATDRGHAGALQDRPFAIGIRQLAGRLPTDFGPVGAGVSRAFAGCQDADQGRRAFSATAEGHRLHNLSLNGEAHFGGVRDEDLAPFAVDRSTSPIPFRFRERQQYDPASLAG